MKTLYLSLIAVLAVFLGACDYSDALEEEEEDAEELMVCDPGETKGCFCVGSSDGITACKNDGSGWTECDCSGVGADFGCNLEGIWFDAKSGLCWEEPVSAEKELVWFEAMEYCRILVIGDHDDWHLPDIDELRTLIRGCMGTETDGYCSTNPTTDTGSGDSCRPDCGGRVEDFDYCEGCPQDNGPGKDGVYLDPALDGFGGLSFWSASTDEMVSNNAWQVDFRRAEVRSVYKNSALAVSCVRSGM